MSDVLRMATIDTHYRDSHLPISALRLHSRRSFLMRVLALRGDLVRLWDATPLVVKYSCPATDHQRSYIYDVLIRRPGLVERYKHGEEQNEEGVGHGDRVGNMISGIFSHLRESGEKGLKHSSGAQDLSAGSSNLSLMFGLVLCLW